MNKYRIDYMYEPLIRTNSGKVRVAAASGLAKKFRIVPPPKIQFKNSPSSVYSGLYGAYSAK